MCRLLAAAGAVLSLVAAEAATAAARSSDADRGCNQISVICGGSGNDRITIPAAEDSRVVYSSGGNDVITTYDANFLYVDSGRGNDTVRSKVGENGQAFIVTGPGNDRITIEGRALIFAGAGRDQIAIGNHRGQFEQVFVDGGDVVTGFLTAESAPETGGDALAAVASWAPDGRNKTIFNLHTLDSNRDHVLDADDPAVTAVMGGLRLAVPGVGSITVIGTPTAPIMRLPLANLARR